jgi:hypothetical protein
LLLAVQPELVPIVTCDSDGRTTSGSLPRQAGIRAAAVLVKLEDYSVVTCFDRHIIGNPGSTALSPVIEDALAVDKDP